MPQARSRRPETVRRILAAAEKEFAQRGMAGARTDEIARAARVNKALLYYYFQSKDRLHRAVLEQLFGHLRAAVEGPVGAASLPREKLVAYVNGFFEFVAGHPNYPRLVQREVMDCGRHLDWIVGNYFRPFQLRLARIIESGVSAGSFRRVDPANTALTITAITVFYFAAAPVMSAVWSRDALAPQAVEARRRSVLDFLDHALLRQPAGRSPKRRS